MNHKQKLGYALIGAAIMAAGMILNALLTPPVTAQHSGKFDTLECRELIVSDAQGVPGITMIAHEDGSLLGFADKEGRTKMSLSVSYGTALINMVDPLKQVDALTIGTSARIRQMQFFNRLGQSVLSLQNGKITISDGEKEKWKAP